MGTFTKLFRKLLLTLIVLVALMAVGISAFFYLSPQFGTGPTEEQIQSYKETGLYSEGRFRNLEPFIPRVDFASLSKVAKRYFNRPDDHRPSTKIEVDKVDPQSLEKSTEPTKDKVIWLGHSSFFIQLDGKNILIDPLFSQYAAPFPWFGVRRYNQELPIDLEALPVIDVVLISHDHYDHLDYHAIKHLLNKTKTFLVPLGVGNHLRGWGVSDDKIHELSWWQEVQLEGQNFVFAPSRHTSGRGLGDQFGTLWGSWVVQGQNHKLYFSGDGGYGKHFATIGEKYGPFDLALMEAGQYDDLWPEIHMTPEESIQASQDLKAELIVPIHWGTLSLAAHTWTEPIIRMTNEAKRKGLKVSTPRMGETLVLGAEDFPTSRWWERYGSFKKTVD